jgi:hypothetical protein
MRLLQPLQSLLQATKFVSPQTILAASNGGGNKGNIDRGGGDRPGLHFRISKIFTCSGARRLILLQ